MQENIQNYIGLISQLILHLNRIPGFSYDKKLSIFGGSTIGEHIRHIYNFPECLLNGLNDGIINYDKRKRSREIETNREYAIEELQKQSNAVLNLIHYQNRALILEVGANEYSPSRINTNLERELHYVIEHTIHHMAILRLALSYHFPDMKIDDSFGFAYSTIAYKMSTNKA